jgi:hypothetical protein
MKSTLARLLTATVPGAASSISTTFTDGNRFDGNMFDVAVGPDGIAVNSQGGHIRGFGDELRSLDVGIRDIRFWSWLRFADAGPGDPLLANNTYSNADLRLTAGTGLGGDFASLAVDPGRTWNGTINY